MIRSVFQICSACAGTGEVEGPKKSPRNPQNQLDKGSETPIPSIVSCYVCKGACYIPTGLFIIMPNSIPLTFDQEMMMISEVERNAIKSKL